MVTFLVSPPHGPDGSLPCVVCQRKAGSGYPDWDVCDPCMEKVECGECGRPGIVAYSYDCAKCEAKKWDKPAVFSPTREYRYSLYRPLHKGDRALAFVMLNPSTADETRNDPSVRRCLGYAQRWGYSALWVLNVFALRSTDPRLLRRHDAPIGPGNRMAFSQVLPRVKTVVCAWGNHGALHGQYRTALEWIRAAGHQPMALRVTKTGQPAHPLYLPKTLEPTPFHGIEEEG